MAIERRKPQRGKQLLLRFAEGSDLRERLDKIAKENGRSTTAEVLLRLEASLQAEQKTGGLSFVKTAKTTAAKARFYDPDLEARVSELEKAVNALQQARS